MDGLNKWIVPWGHEKGASCPTYERKEDLMQKSVIFYEKKLG